MANNQIISDIKTLRLKIDGLAQLTKGLNPKEKEYSIKENYNINFQDKNFYSVKISENWSTQIEKAVDSLYLAKAWLGKIAGELGENTPYTNDGKRKTVEDIEPAQDVAHNKLNEFLSDGNGQEWKNKSHIEKVDWLRTEIEKLVNETDPYRNEGSISWSMSTKGMAYLFNTNRHLSEARFWLGFELQRIKEAA